MSSDEDVVYQLARHGLTAVASHTGNGPAVVAQAAAALERWRLSRQQRESEIKQPEQVTP